MPHDPWIDLSHPCPSALTTPWRESRSKSLFPEKYCSISLWTEPRTGPDHRGRFRKAGKEPRCNSHRGFLGIIALVDHVSRRLQVFIDSGISLPLVHQPIANAELETELFHIPVIGIEMLMVHHPRRHMHGVALIPIIAFAANL